MSNVTVYCARCHNELIAESYGDYNVNVQPCDCLQEDVNLELLEACCGLLEGLDANYEGEGLTDKQWQRRIQDARAAIRLATEDNDE